MLVSLAQPVFTAVVYSNYTSVTDVSLCDTCMSESRVCWFREGQAYSYRRAIDGPELSMPISCSGGRDTFKDDMGMEKSPLTYFFQPSQLRSWECRSARDTGRRLSYGQFRRTIIQPGYIEYLSWTDLILNRS